MDVQYIQTVEYEGDESIEIPSEDDGTLLLTTLAAQFPGACGLKYRNPDTGAFRGIRLVEGVLHPPEGVWGNHQFLAVFPKENKRKGEGEESYDNPAAKTKRLAESKCSDLIVLGLPWKSTEEDLTKYFTQFGELVLVQVKRDIKTNQSKGFGFIRFKQYESQVKCCSQRHMLDGRWCDVTIPNSKQGDDVRGMRRGRDRDGRRGYDKGYDFSSSRRSRNNYNFDDDDYDDGDTGYKEGSNQMMNRKVFIGRVTEDISADDLRNYFAKFGEVVDVFIPKPYRAFAFVTFQDADTAQNLCGEDHIIKGASVHVSSAAPKSFDKGNDRKGYGHGGGYGNQSHGGGYGNQRGMGQGPIGGKNMNGDAGGMAPGNIGMNLLNSAMLAAAQAMLQNGGNWGGMNPGQNQGGAGGNMGAGDHQAPPPMGLPSNQGFNQASNQGASGGNWWGTEGGSSSGGHYGGWGGGSHGRGTGGWS